MASSQLSLLSFVVDTNQHSSSNSCTLRRNNVHYLHNRSVEEMRKICVHQGVIGCHKVFIILGLPH